MSILVNDLRIAVRRISGRAWPSALAVLSVAVGVAVCLFAFGATRVLVRPDNVLPEPGSLLRVQEPAVSYGEYLAIRDGAEPYVTLAASRNSVLALWEEARPVVLPAETVSANYFEALHLQLAAGRVPSAGEVGTVVVSHRLWRERFGGEASIIGRALSFGSRKLTVVGVAPKGYTGVRRMGATQVWEIAVSGSRTDRSWQMLGQTRAAVPVEGARAALGTAIEASVPSDPQTAMARRPRVAIEAEVDRSRVTRVALVTALAGLILLVACANVAALLTASFEERRGESALRAALGAGRWRIVRLLLTEAFALSTLGAVLGIGLARWALAALRDWLPPMLSNLGVRLELRIDHQTLFVALTAVVVATLVAGVAPAVGASRASLSPILQQHMAGPSGGRWRVHLREVLTLTQVCLSFAFLAAAVTFLRAPSRSADDQRASDDMIMLFAAEPQDEAARYSVLAEVVERVRSVPGVSSATLTSAVPGQETERLPIHLGTQAGRSVGRVAVQAPYFGMMELALLRGRLLSEADERLDAQVAVVSATAAAKLWPDGDPLGQLVRMGTENARPVEVVGVVSDVPRHDGGEPGEDVGVFYVPFGPSQAQNPGQRLMMIRAAGGVRDLGEGLRQKLRARDADVVVLELQTLRSFSRLARLPVELGSILMSVQGLLAIALVMAGLHGVVADAVIRRRAEIGIRLSLGATRADVAWLIVRRSMSVCALGLGAGGLLAFGVVGAVRSMVPGLPAMGIGTLLLAFAGVVATIAVASYFPVRHATRIDPAQALRCE